MRDRKLRRYVGCCVSQAPEGAYEITPLESGLVWGGVLASALL